jgi:O-antigen/teichoic acid export membrane protein
MTIDAEIEPTGADEQQVLHERALESRALKGTYFVVLFYGASMALRMVNSVVLTHYFAPDLFGLMALVTTFIVGLTLFSHIGLEDSVIQNPRGDDETFLNTAWTIQTIRGSGIFLVTALIAWPVAQFYHDPRMLWLLPILGFGCVIAGFSSPNLLTLSRHLGVGRLSVLELATQFVLFASTVLCAILWTRSVWALAIGRIVSELFRTAISYRVARSGYRPRFVLEKEAVHGHLRPLDSDRNRSHLPRPAVGPPYPLQAHHPGHAGHLQHRLPALRRAPPDHPHVLLQGRLPLHCQAGP